MKRNGFGIGLSWTTINGEPPYEVAAQTGRSTPENGPQRIRYTGTGKGNSRGS
jgi:hypothetical protein